MKGLLSPTIFTGKRSIHSTNRHLIWVLLVGLLACQPEPAKEQNRPAQDAVATPVSDTSDQLIDELKKSYEKKIDSILSLQNQENSELQNQLASLIKEAEALAAYNQNLDLQVGQQANDIQRLQDSLQAVLDQNNESFEVPFNAVALTEETLDSLVESTGTTNTFASFDALDSDFDNQSFLEEMDSLVREINESKTEATIQEKRLDGILSNLTVAIEPKSQKSGKGYEDVIINTLLSTVSDDTLIVNQFNRGFYTKQDLNALIGDYKARKTERIVSGELVIYRRKKKQDQQSATIYVDGAPYSFTRNTIDTIQVNNVFDVQVCSAKNQCESMAFSSQMPNYVEVSLSKNTETNEINPVNQVLGEFYARQVASSKQEK